MSDGPSYVWIDELMMFIRLLVMWSNVVLWVQRYLYCHLVKIAKWKSCDMNIIDMWISDTTLVIELHDDITVKETGLNCAFVLSESFVLQGT